MRVIMSRVAKKRVAGTRMNDRRSRNEIARRLAIALSDATNNGVFEPGKFFSRWFREMGSAYFFLFQKNLKVTNVQYAELLALVEAHTSDLSGAVPRKLMFHATTDFTATVRSIITPLIAAASDHKVDFFHHIAQLYVSTFEKSVVVNPFFGSCAV